MHVFNLGFPYIIYFVITIPRASYLCDILGCDRQQVDLVGHALGGLDGGDVGVDQDGLYLLLLEGLQRLRARVVKLTRLTDGQTTRAQDENLLRVPCYTGDFMGLLGVG